MIGLNDNKEKNAKTHQLCFFIGIQSEKGSTPGSTVHSQSKLPILHLLASSTGAESHGPLQR